MENDPIRDEDENVAFKSLGLNEVLCEACRQLKWRRPSGIQREAIPVVLQGHDVIGLAETGSGKTGAYALPILQRLIQHQLSPLFALILTPSRELAHQISEQFDKLGRDAGVKTGLIIGGVEMVDQAIQLAKKPHIVIATPGRMLEHLENTNGFKLNKLQYLVLDEADKILNMDFEEEVNKILKLIPKSRQTLLFSATMTDKVSKLQKASLKDPVKLEVSFKYQTPKTLTQQYLLIPNKHKEIYLYALIKNFKDINKKTSLNPNNTTTNNNTNTNDITNNTNDITNNTITTSNTNENTDNITNNTSTINITNTIISTTNNIINDNTNNTTNNNTTNNNTNNNTNNTNSIIIFCNTCIKTVLISRLLKHLGLQSIFLHGQLSQEKRLECLGKFRRREKTVLVATDLASRGLDISHVDLVINYDLPDHNKDYFHRVGRTARAGEVGSAVSLVTQYDIKELLGIENLLGFEIGLLQMDKGQVMKLDEVVYEAKKVAKRELAELQKRKMSQTSRKETKRKGDGEGDDDDGDADDDHEESKGVRRKFKKSRGA